MTDNVFTHDEWLAGLRALGVNPGVVDDREAPMAIALNAVLPLYRERVIREADTVELSTELARRDLERRSKVGRSGE